MTPGDTSMSIRALSTSVSANNPCLIFLDTIFNQILYLATHLSQRALTSLSVATLTGEKNTGNRLTSGLCLQ